MGFFTRTAMDALMKTTHPEINRRQCWNLHMRIQKAFARMMQGRTSFIVAHRLSTIREADVILVMKDGHIVEQGDHDELLAKGGFYAKLYNSQFEGVQT